MAGTDENASSQTDIRVIEAHHRIKNSLQLACSMLRLQAMKYTNSNLENELLQASSRIALIAKVHDHLCRTQHSQMDVASFLQDLCADLPLSLSLTAGQSVHVMAAHIFVPPTVATSLGLIVNELVTNAFKHAYRDGVTGKVQVAFIPLEDGSCQLTVADRGVGLPEAAEMVQHGGFGMVFIENLSNTLNAQFAIDRTPPGTRFTLRLPPLEQLRSAATIYA
jgi:two-component sensor histidine kinase